MTKSEKKPSILYSFVRQLLFLLLFVILFFVGLRFFMRTYTNYGQAIEVPDFKEMTLEEAKKLAKKNKLRVEIDDSTFMSDIPPGQIIDQNPKPNSNVKKRRTIYFVVNSSTPPPVKVPNLVDNTFRQAKLQIENLGLKVGKKIYKPDLAKDVVLDIQHNGKSVKAGDIVLKGQTIDLVLGDGFGNTTMRIPDLLGLPLAEAKIIIADAGLVVGQVTKSENVTDENLAIIIEQSPASVVGQTLEKGESIDLHITQLN